MANSACNFALSAIFEEWNGDESRAEMSQLVSEKNINNFIIENITDDVQLMNVLEHAKDLGVQLRFLPENRRIIETLEKRNLEKSLNQFQKYLEARPAMVIFYFIFFNIIKPKKI